MLANVHNDHGHLLQKVAGGDSGAFRELFKLYWDNIYSVALRMTKSKVIAEEIVQDVFIKVWNGREKLASVRNFDNYLYIIGRNHIYNHLRQSPLLFSPLVESIDASLTPEQQLCFKETGEMVSRAVQQLSTQQRIIFDMSREQGLDYSTIAQKLNLSSLTVKTHMHKAIQSIKAYVARHQSTFLLVLIVISFIS